MFVLALDTSSAAVSAGVYELDDRSTDTLRSHERSVLNSRGHGEALAPLIAGCLAEAGIEPAHLGAVVAGLGPGPFTGLRVGLVTAAVLGELLGLPTYGVCSLDGIAGQVALGRLLVAGDARRREVYWARYSAGIRVAGPEVCRAADVPIGDSDVMAGAGARLYADVLGLGLLDADYPSTAALVRTAAARIRARAPGEVLVPLYLRRPDAVAPGAPKTVTR